MTAEDVPRIQRTVHRKVQMVGFDKFFQICRAEEIFLFSVSIFQIKAVDIVGAFLNHDGTGGVVGCDADCAVLHAGSGDDLADLF